MHTECNTWTPSATVKNNNNNSSCKNSINNNINISSSEKPGHWARSRATVGGKGHTECHSGLCQSSLFLRKNTTCRQRCTLQHVCCIQHYITHNVTTSISSLSFGAPLKELFGLNAQQHQLVSQSGSDEPCPVSQNR